MSYFTTKGRESGERFTLLRDDAPDWVRDAVQEAHDGELPNDWRYNVAASLFWELPPLDQQDWDDRGQEIIDGLVDIATSDLFRWVADVPSRTEYADEYAEMIGDTLDDRGVTGLLMGAQFLAIERMASVIWEAIESERAGVLS